MNKLITLICGLMIATSAVLAQGTIYQVGTTTSLYDTVKTGPVQLISLQLIETTGTNTFVQLYDSADETNVIVNAAYKYVLSYSTNLTNTFIDMAGVTHTNVTTVLYSTTLTNAAATNTAAVVYQMLIPANSTVLWSPTSPQSFTRGVTFCTTNAARANAISYNLLYKALP